MARQFTSILQAPTTACPHPIVPSPSNYFESSAYGDTVSHLARQVSSPLPRINPSPISKNGPTPISKGALAAESQT